MSGRRNGQSGFTLLEMLVAIAIMGVLSGGAVVGVSAVRRSAQDAACTVDADAIGTAEQASFATTGSYLDEQGLIDAGYLREPSAHFDVSSTALGFELVPVDGCTVPGPELAAADPATPPDTAPQEAADPDPAAPGPDATVPDPVSVPVDSAGAGAKPADPSPPSTEPAEVEPTTTAPASTVPAATGCGKGQVDINSADKKELRAISGVGGDEATRIVKQRPFRSLDQLSEVKGLSAAQVETIIAEGVACIG